MYLVKVKYINKKWLSNYFLSNVLWKPVIKCFLIFPIICNISLYISDFEKYKEMGNFLMIKNKTKY